jgi:hypothetical protein
MLRLTQVSHGFADNINMRVSSVLSSTNKILFLLVLVLGWGVYYSLFSSPPKSLLLNSTNAHQELILVESASTREIASETKLTSSKKSLRDTAMDVLNIDCQFLKSQLLRNQDSFQVRAPKVRLKLIGCGKDKRQIEVLNNTNGYSASLFELEDGTISTDFMDINEGSNSMEIKREINGSHSSYNLTISRVSILEVN